MIKLLLYPINGSPREISNRAYELVRAQMRDKSAKILKGDMGKPYLESKEFYFSISHTSTLIAIALAPFDLGIDMEKAERKIPEGVGKRFLGGNCDISSWVHFEAFSKLHGGGIPVGYEKMTSTPHNYCMLEMLGHKICICSYGDMTVTLI